MLRQEINLYPKIKSVAPPTRWLSWKFLWLSNVIFISFFILIYFTTLWNVSYLKSKISQLNIQKKELQDNFFKLKDTFPKTVFSQNMDQSIAQLKQEVLIEKMLLKDIENYTPFSEDLISFSHIIVPDVWLTDILIEKGGETIVIKGKSSHSTNLQFFLDKISKDKQFKNYSLRANNIEEKKIDSGTFSFTFHDKKIKE